MGGRAVIHALPVDVIAVEDEVLMSLRDTIDVDECEDEAFLRAMRASRDSREIFLQCDIGHALPVEVRHVLYRLLVSLLDDLAEDVRNDINDILSRYDASSIQRVSFFVGDTLALVHKLLLSLGVHQ